MKFKQLQKKIVGSNDGQTFMEFILLIAILVTISTVTMRLINTQVAKKWKTSVEMIASPDIDNLTRIPL